MLTTKVPVRDSEVERAKGLAGEDPGSVVEICEDSFEVLVHFRSESEVVDEDDGGVQDGRLVLGVEEIALRQSKFGVAFPVKFHPEAKPFLHVLRENKNRIMLSINKLKKN